MDFTIDNDSEPAHTRLNFGDNHWESAGIGGALEKSRMPETHTVRTGVLFSDVAPEITVTLPAFFVQIKRSI